MDEIISKALLSASRSLATLSKTRCVEDYEFLPEHRYKLLHAWPSAFDSDPAVIALLTNRHIDTTRHFKVKSYSVPHDRYRDRYRPVECPEVIDIRIARTLLHVFELTVEDPDTLDIEVVWDMSEHPSRRAPATLSTGPEMLDFSRHRDAMFVFARPSSQYSLKIPAFAHRALILAMPRLQGVPLVRKDRIEYAGRHTDDRGISQRHIVRRADMRQLSDVLSQTCRAISRLVGDHAWVRALNEEGRLHYDAR